MISSMMRKPKKPATVQIGIRLPQPEAERLRAEAEKADRNVSQQIRHLLKRAYAAQSAQEIRA
ncbi:MAG: ribbon-helix-helix protein, CopG family [Acidobacteria bacterium]|nr:MAG: ribbon-helix-helix protein, CopG family [Acidobacteriota bacterium]